MDASPTPELFCIDETGIALLRRMLGRRAPWIFGTAFLVEAELIVATRMAMSVGKSGSLVADDECLWFGSERLESSVDYLDYAQFRVGVAKSLGEALGTEGLLFQDTSVVVTTGPTDNIQHIRIIAARIAEENRQIEYDALIRFELDSGRVLTIGHSPGVYEGVCMARGDGVTLGNPKQLRERLVLSA